MSQRTFDAPDLETALERVRREIGTDAEIVGAERVRSGGIAGFFARERVEVTVRLPNEDLPAADAAVPSTLLELAEHVDAIERATVSTEGPSFAAVLDRITAQVGADRPDDGVAATDAITAASAPELAALVKAGLPPALVPAPSAAVDLVAALVRAFRELPVPPPLPVLPGAVVAVVGPGRHAVSLARELSANIGGDPADVVVASPGSDGDTPPWLHLGSAGAALERRSSWRRRCRATVVAVAAGDTHEDDTWSRHVLAALEPTAVWGVVDATRKTEDVAAWIDAIGGVDALAVHGIDRTVTPGAVLSLGVPVASIDGRRATPARWASILVDRIAA